MSERESFGERTLAKSARDARASRPRLLDLFCGAGGCSVGYHRAGFDVVGVDIAPQPRYPFKFVQADALAVLESVMLYPHGGFDAIHASPPCQFATAYRRTGNVKPSTNLIPQTRELIEATGLPYVIENVEEARGELHDPMLLCGSMFDLDVQRHRLFETNWPLQPPAWPCRHRIWGRDRFPGGRSKQRTGSSRGLVRGTVEIGSWDIPLDVQRRAMGVDWMTLEELSEAIPPAFTEHIGHQLMQHVVLPQPFTLGWYVNVMYERVYGWHPTEVSANGVSAPRSGANQKDRDVR